MNCMRVSKEDFDIASLPRTVPVITAQRAISERALAAAVPPAADKAPGSQLGSRRSSLVTDSGDENAAFPDEDLRRTSILSIQTGYGGDSMDFGAWTRASPLSAGNSKRGSLRSKLGAEDDAQEDWQRRLSCQSYMTDMGDFGEDPGDVYARYRRQPGAQEWHRGVLGDAGSRVPPPPVLPPGLPPDSNGARSHGLHPGLPGSPHVAGGWPPAQPSMYYPGYPGYTPPGAQVPMPPYGSGWSSGYAGVPYAGMSPSPFYASNSQHHQQHPGAAPPSGANGCSAAGAGQGADGEWHGGDQSGHYASQSSGRGAHPQAAAPHASKPPIGRTTVMLRNMPELYLSNDLTEMMDREGFVGLYDFVYMPMNFRTKASFGYAFVNLVTHEAAQRCHDKFQGFAHWCVHTERVCEVTWSDMHQGLAAHIERYRNSPVMHESVPDEYKPVMYSGGVRALFPPPTKRLRQPRIRRLTEGGDGEDDDECPEDGPRPSRSSPMRLPVPSTSAQEAFASASLPSSPTGRPARGGGSAGPASLPSGPPAVLSPFRAPHPWMGHHLSVQQGPR